LISFPSRSDNALRELNVLLNGEFVVMPLDVTGVTELNSDGVDRGHRGMEREICEIDLRGEGIIVTLSKVRQDIRSWIGGCKMMNSTEEAAGRSCSESFQTSQNHHLSAADVNTTDEDFETIRNDGGIKVRKIWDGCEVLEGGQVDSFVEGSLEDPRNAP
jgi:hypothetical protein